MNIVNGQLANICLALLGFPGSLSQIMITIRQLTQNSLLLLGVQLFSELEMLPGQVRSLTPGQTTTAM
jgi:hypothetical protein